MIVSSSNDKKAAFVPFLLIGVIFLGAIYFILAYWYLSVAKSKDTTLVQDHATIIAHDLWNLNDSGMHAYLDLVARTDHYRTLEVLADDGEIFLKLTGPKQGVIDTVLLHIGLIETEHLSFPVSYGGNDIGILKGERYIRYVYPLFYIFLALSFIALTLTFIFYLIFNRRLLEQQVRERTRRYHELVNLLPEMVLETDAEGGITFANENAQVRLGIPDYTNEQNDCREYIRLADGERADHSIYLETKREDLERKEYRARSADGVLIPVLVRSAPIYSNDRFIGARMVIVDITERVALEEQLNRDQKMKSIGMMAGGVAHDLNNILSGIVNYPELILQKLPNESPLIKLIEPIKEAGLRAAAVVADLLTVARGVAAAKKSANLNEIIQDYTDSPEFDKLRLLYPNINYTMALSPGIDSISCSIIHIRKSLMNLVTNASEAVDGAGLVTIETANTTVDKPITTDHGIIDPGLYVTLSVKDSGQGISPHELNHIFEPFYSKKELGRSGTGLGLTVVLSTLQDHSGGILVNSGDNGSTFELYFPRSLENKRDTASPKNMDSFMGSGEIILIVDDEFQQRDIASRLLESLDYNVVSLSTGREAVDYVRTTQVDLVLLDMVLGSGMSGLSTYEEILRARPDQKAIIVSGFSENDDVRKTIRMGAGGLVNKPYTFEQLGRAVFNELTRDSS